MLSGNWRSLKLAKRLCFPQGQCRLEEGLEHFHANEGFGRGVCANSNGTGTLPQRQAWLSF